MVNYCWNMRYQRNYKMACKEDCRVDSWPQASEHPSPFHKFMGKLFISNYRTQANQREL